MEESFLLEPIPAEREIHDQPSAKPDTGLGNVSVVEVNLIEKVVALYIDTERAGCPVQAGAYQSVRPVALRAAGGYAVLEKLIAANAVLTAAGDIKGHPFQEAEIGLRRHFVAKILQSIGRLKIRLQGLVLSDMAVAETQAGKEEVGIAL